MPKVHFRYVAAAMQLCQVNIAWRLRSRYTTLLLKVHTSQAVSFEMHKETQLVRIIKPCGNQFRSIGVCPVSIYVQWALLGGVHHVLRPAAGGAAKL